MMKREKHMYRLFLKSDNTTKDIVVSLLNEIKIKNPEKFAKKTEEFILIIKSL